MPSTKAPGNASKVKAKVPPGAVPGQLCSVKLPKMHKGSCPPGLKAGDSYAAIDSCGQQVQVTIPDGIVFEGQRFKYKVEQEFHVQIPLGAEPGDIVELEATPAPVAALQAVPGPMGGSMKFIPGLGGSFSCPPPIGGSMTFPAVQGGSFQLSAQAPVVTAPVPAPMFTATLPAASLAAVLSSDVPKPAVAGGSATFPAPQVLGGIQSTVPAPMLTAPQVLPVGGSMNFPAGLGGSFSYPPIGGSMTFPAVQGASFQLSAQAPVVTAPVLAPMFSAPLPATALAAILSSDVPKPAMAGEGATFPTLKVLGGIQSPVAAPTVTAPQVLPVGGSMNFGTLPAPTIGAPTVVAGGTMQMPTVVSQPFAQLPMEAASVSTLPVAGGNHQMPVTAAPTYTAAARRVATVPTTSVPFAAPLVQPFSTRPQRFFQPTYEPTVQGAPPQLAAQPMMAPMGGAPMHGVVGVEGALRFLPQVLSGRRVLVEVAPNTWKATNDQYGASTRGLGYRKSKNLDDFYGSDAIVLREEILFWGNIVKGVNTGDGWVQILAAPSLAS